MTITQHDMLFNKFELLRSLYLLFTEGAHTESREINIYRYIPHNLAYKTRFLWWGRLDRGNFEHNLIGRIILWQSTLPYRRARFADIIRLPKPAPNI